MQGFDNGADKRRGVAPFLTGVATGSALSNCSGLKFGPNDTRFLNFFVDSGVVIYDLLVAMFSFSSSVFSGVFAKGSSTSWNATEERLKLPMHSLNDARRGKGFACSPAFSGVFITGSSTSWNGTEDLLNFPILSLNDARRGNGLGVFGAGSLASSSDADDLLIFSILCLNDARRGKGLGGCSTVSGDLVSGSSTSWNGTDDRLSLPILSLNDSRRRTGLRGLSLTTRFASLRGDARFLELFNDSLFCPKLYLK